MQSIRPYGQKMKKHSIDGDMEKNTIYIIPIKVKVLTLGVWLTTIVLLVLLLDIMAKRSKEV